MRRYSVVGTVLALIASGKVIPILGYYEAWGATLAAHSLSIRKIQFPAKPLYSIALFFAPDAEMKAWILQGRGHGHLFSNNRQEAIADLTESLALNPNDGNTFRYRGTASMFSNRAGALQDFNRALEINPSDAYAHARMAEISVMSGQFGAASIEYSAAIGLDKSDARSLLHRGQINEHEGNLQQAIADYAAVLKINPDDHDTLERLSVLESITLNRVTFSDFQADANTNVGKLFEVIEVLDDHRQRACRKGKLDAACENRFKNARDQRMANLVSLLESAVREVARYDTAIQVNSQAVPPKVDLPEPTPLPLPHAQEPINSGKKLAMPENMTNAEASPTQITPPVASVPRNAKKNSTKPKKHSRNNTHKRLH
jgi:tetratricopeptide (TPR) repeat protein